MSAVRASNPTVKKQESSRAQKPCFRYKGASPIYIYRCHVFIKPAAENAFEKQHCFVASGGGGFVCFPGYII